MNAIITPALDTKEIFLDDQSESVRGLVDIEIALVGGGEFIALGG